jgi:hypothetical protein
VRTSLAPGAAFSLFEADNNGQIKCGDFRYGNGSSFFGVQAVAGQSIRFIGIVGMANSIQDVGQVRLGGIVTAETFNAAAAVPEPSESVAMAMAARPCAA